MLLERKTNPTILIIDDNPTNISVLFDLLEKSNFKTLMALDGEQGVIHAENGQPDIILLDILMPGMDGFETCKILKDNPKTYRIPIIFMTAVTETEQKIKGFSLGAADYITKPFHHEEVISRIKTHLMIRRQQQKLEELNATKDKFFSIIAHDLRNPFNALVTATDFLIDSFEDLEKEVLKSFLIDINNTSNQTLNLLENLLNWARSQSGHLVTSPRLFRLAEVVEQNLLLISEKARKKSIAVNSSIDETQRVYADKNMVSTIFRNILSNAVKFTQEDGTIRISTDNRGSYVIIAISDNGIGISEENQQKLFKIDIKCTTLGADKETGTGLGLILCKEFVQKNGGEIWVESKPECGSTFFFTLPTRPPKE